MLNLTNSQEPEPLGKKIRSRSRLENKSGSVASKKLAGSSALFNNGSEL